ncbi:MAG: UDP-2,3-diacylglucosamine diphosphatase LpxI [Myxococcota bacterium]|nr:UDP-2,3-diacylglucosamine diphosphatase LpxI [Myxococcota bacterium]
MNATLPTGCPVGILAGSGAYPSLLASALMARGYKVVVAGIKGQCIAALPSGVGSRQTVYLGAFAETVRFFSSSGTHHIFLAGGINRAHAWRSARPDRHSTALLPQALFGGDDGLLKAVVARLEKLGVWVCDPRPFIDSALAPIGRMAGPSPDPITCGEITLARQAAAELGRRDVGQAVLVYRGQVVGTEGRDGTDALIAAAPGPGAVLVKMAKPGQDLRFDLPTIGPTTALLARAAHLQAIGVAAGNVLLLGQDRVIDICNRADISLIGF